MQYITCNLCDSKDYTVVFESNVAQKNQIVRCKDCGFMYANPRLVAPDCFQVPTFDPQWVLTHSDKRFSKESLQVRDYQSTRTFLDRYYPQKGKLLEIGCGFGYLLDFFKQQGWDVTGVEPLKAGCLHAKTKFKIEVVPTIVEDAGFEDNAIDVTLMMHVIEHVPDPAGTLKEIYRILKPGGLLVLETPRYDTWTFKILGKRERSLSCNGHIYFFTGNTLQAMATKVGFQVVKSECVGRSLTLERLVWNLGTISKNKDFQYLVERLSKRLRLDRVWVHLNVRDMQRVILQKPA
jgi:2-polyprenyl-3-methyl-5-hydroxy-6-metoxy-1,4-benzoquinol methylase